MPPFRRRVPPPVAQTTAVHQAAVPPPAYEAVDPHWLARIDDRLRSLQTALTLVGVIAVVALGVAIYALLRDNDSDGRNGTRNAASASRVSKLERRVDDLSDRPTTSAAVQSDIADLQDQVKTLGATIDKTGSTASSNEQQLSTSVKDLADRLDTLEQQVADLTAAQQSGAATQGTTTTP